MSRARKGGGPALIEAMTYRHSGHSRADPAKYRPEGELEEWLEARSARDLPRRGCSKLGVAEPTLADMEGEAMRKVDEATATAKASPAPSLDDDREERVGGRRRGMAELTYRDAVAAGIAQEMERDERVVFLGEDVAAAGGVFKTTVGLLERFGPKRVRDCPISEQAIIGAAMGAAMTGLRPIAEIMFSDFLAVCWDIVANEIAKTRYMTNGQITLPLVIRTANGAGSRFGAQHSQAVENWAMAIPGLKVVAPSTPADVKGLLAAAVRDPDPVIFFEQKSLYSDEGRGARRRARRASWARRRCCASGKDCTIVALAAMVHAVAGGGRDRWKRSTASRAPWSTCARWCRSTRRRYCRRSSKTGRLVTVEENPRLCGWGAEIASIVADECFWDLDGPIVRITTPHIPLPSADALEDRVDPVGRADRAGDPWEKRSTEPRRTKSQHYQWT